MRFAAATECKLIEDLMEEGRAIKARLVAAEDRRDSLNLELNEILDGMVVDN